MRLTLSNAALRAAVQTQGGELVSLRDPSGVEYIWQGDPAFWSGQNPTLFPIVGSLKDGRVDIDGRTFEMARHGFARRSVFTVAEQGGDYAVLELREGPETLARYPFPFVLRIRHQLLEDGFTTAFTVENPGGAPMPFCIGAHTAINCPLFPGERFEDYALVFDQPEDADTLLLTPEGLLRAGGREPMLRAGETALDYDTFRRLDTVIFQGLRSKSVALRHKDTGRGVSLDFSQFPMIAFWTKPGAPFLCMEPWHGCAALDDESGRFQDKPHVVTLAPGERKDLAYTFTLL
ncbi:aldose 1-epimerase family protein [uncultured Oscillibacter sp.]|uniref:aldose 1-epimerase family protein n=1 Tax=uncultured Oscillibacter sp. TaxID=876091 RepID=UPI0025D0FFC1|nr:aldose 1-epimerase family protein [uncultured Oscillibacter sp.]